MPLSKQGGATWVKPFHYGLPVSCHHNYLIRWDLDPVRFERGQLAYTLVASWFRPPALLADLSVSNTVDPHPSSHAAPSGPPRTSVNPIQPSLGPEPIQRLTRLHNTSFNLHLNTSNGPAVRPQSTPPLLVLAFLFNLNSRSSSPPFVYP